MNKDITYLLNIVSSEFNEEIISFYKDLYYQMDNLKQHNILEIFYFSLTFFRYFGHQEEKNNLHLHYFLQALFESYRYGHLCLSLPFGSSFVKEKLFPTQLFKYYLIENQVDGRVLVIQPDNKKKEYHCYFNEFYKGATTLFEYFTAQKRKIIDSSLIDKIALKVNDYEKYLSFTLNQGQKEALYRSTAAPFSIIQGGPGTGKTTLIMLLLECFIFFSDRSPQNLNISILGFTGRSVARVQESLDVAIKENSHFILLKDLFETKKIFFQTIDNFLLKVKQPLFEDNPQVEEIDFLIIDELSMVAVRSLSSVLKCVKPNTKVVLIGDPHQLPSIEAGAVFDLLSSQVFDLSDYTSLLKESMRSKSSQLNLLLENMKKNSLLEETSYIQSYYHKILEIPTPTTKEIYELNDLHKLMKYQVKEDLEYLIKKEKQGVYFINLDSNHSFISENKILEELFQFSYKEQFELFQQKLKSKEEKATEEIILKSLSMVENFRILSPLNDGMLGIKEVNKKYHDIYQFHFGTYALGCPVLINKNLPHLNLTNGDMGVGVGDQFYLKKGERIVSIPLRRIDHYEISYGTSIHKSQGSEYSTVVILLPQYTPSQLLTRQIIYTALSRAKEKVIIIGYEKVMLTSLNTTFRRNSGIFY